MAHAYSRRGSQVRSLLLSPETQAVGVAARNSIRGPSPAREQTDEITPRQVDRPSERDCGGCPARARVPRQQGEAARLVRSRLRKRGLRWQGDAAPALE